MGEETGSSRDFSTANAADKSAEGESPRDALEIIHTYALMAYIGPTSEINRLANIVYVGISAGDSLKARVAELEAALETSVAMLTELEEFHDDHTAKPCGDHDKECPIAMAEWFSKDDRTALAHVRASLSRAKHVGVKS